MSDVLAQTTPLKQRAFPNLNRGAFVSPFRKKRDAHHLTPRQATFVDEYIENGGEAGKAASTTNGNGRSDQFLKSRVVLKAIAQRAAIIAKGANVTPEDVIENLQRIGGKAEDAGQYAPAIKAQELIGKQIGMFIERSLNINVDATQAHLHALKAKMEARRQPKLVGQATIAKDDPFAGV